MSTPALLTKDDSRRLTEAARASGCPIVVKRGDAEITIFPDVDSLKSAKLDTGNNEAALSLDHWRKRRNANKGSRRA